MSGSITLHSKLGVNPRLTVCPRCGGDGDELLLLGSQNKKYTCSKCGTLHFGLPDKRMPDGRKSSGRHCQKCGWEYGGDWKSEELTDWERLPAPNPCKKCRDELNEFRKEVEKGGIYWKCTDCKRSGVIKADVELAKLVRNEMDIKPPDPVGIEFSKKDCPACGPSAVLTPDDK